MANLSIPTSINVQTVKGNVQTGTSGATAINAGAPVSYKSAQLQPAGCNTGTTADADVVGVALNSTTAAGQTLVFQTDGVLQVNAGTNAVQTLTMTGGPTGGTFTLTYGGQTTAGIAYNADANDVQNALLALSSIGGVGPGGGTGLSKLPNVSCAGGPLPGTPITVTFQGNLGGQPITLMTANSSGLTGGVSPTMTPSTTTTGVASIVTGQQYDLSATAGAIAPDSDLATGNLVSRIGTGGAVGYTSPGLLTLDIRATRISHA